MQIPASARPWHIALWAVQIVLALFFGSIGILKIRLPLEEAAAQMPWVLAYPSWTLKFIGVSELLGALGLVLPSLLRILPGLTPTAGLALATIMVLAGFYHAGQGEYPAIAVNVVLGLMAVFVAWGRWKKVPVQPRRP